MGKRGRPRIYDTEEERKAGKQQSDNISRKKYNTKIFSNPKSKKEAIKKQVESNKRLKAKKDALRKQLVYLLSAILEIKNNEASTNCYKESRAKKENKTKKIKTIPSQKALPIIKPMQLQAACEQSAEIGIQKNTLPAEAKKTVHSPV